MVLRNSSFFTQSDVGGELNLRFMGKKMPTKLANENPEFKSSGIGFFWLSCPSTGMANYFNSGPHHLCFTTGRVALLNIFKVIFRSQYLRYFH